MKSYLGLVSKYAKVHKKKNRLTVICIAISVMLVTAIFGMADISIKAQINEGIRMYGNWHAIVTNISDEIAASIATHADVAVSGRVGVTADAELRGETIQVQGGDEDITAQMNLLIEQGVYPQTASECALDRLAMEQFDLSVGDSIQITDENEAVRTYIIAGVYRDFSALKANDSHGLFLSLDGIRAFSEGTYREYFYIQFKDGVNINNALEKIEAEFGLSKEQVSTNKRLLALMGQSDDNNMLQLYLTAAILAILVAMAGTFMIATSFNMSILERTQFFGMLRCLGATKRQIKRYIRLEGLRYSVIGVPIGLLAGCCVIWIAVAFLNTLNSRFLPEMPMQFSLLGLFAGAVIGVVTVMLASHSPAKKAASVSPQAAVTGNLQEINNLKVNGASNTKLFRVDTAMGVNHALSIKKNLILITGSFAISIVMFLCFSVFIEFMGNAVKPLQPYAPDISVIGTDTSILLDHSLLDDIKEIPDAKSVYARMFLYDIPASANQRESSVMLISYDAPQFEWARNDLITGNMEDVQNGNRVFVEYSEDMKWNVGDIITLNIKGKAIELQIGGILSNSPFTSQNNEWQIICSESTFTALSGVSNYTIIDVQATVDISTQVRSLISSNMRMLDQFQSNNEARATYNAMAVFVYGFLIVIALVTLINIINTVNASVSSRMNHYGVMRAVGMSGKQMKKVVRAEAVTYAVTGSIAGGILGLFLHRFFFQMLITSNWGELWKPPLLVLAVVILAAILTTFIAVIAPTRKIERTSIVNVVNAE